MSAAQTMEQDAEASPRLQARIAGVFYLIIIVVAPIAELFVRGRLVVYGDAAATAANILAHQSLWRLAGVTDLITFTCDAAVALLFYELFKPAGKKPLLACGVLQVLVCRHCCRQHTQPLCSTDPLGRRALLHCIQQRSTARPGARVSPFARHRLRCRSGVFWISLHVGWNPHLQVNLPSANSRLAHGHCRLVLPDQQLR